jgi:hypothetical protein
MKLNFNRQNMEIGTPASLWMRAMMPASTGGADLSECLGAVAGIKEGDDASWVSAWKALAEGLRSRAEAWLAEGQPISARDSYLRSSNYFRAALIRCRDGAALASEVLDSSRGCFEAAARLFDPPIEAVRIPFGDCVLPGYYRGAGKPDAPTLVCVNGGDSTNEELYPVLGLGARERGWNCLVFEAPGQFTAAQLNPGKALPPDFEKPIGAVIDWLLGRPEVDPARIALFGWSLSSTLVMRAAAFEKRIAAVVSDGLVVDIYEAWYGTGRSGCSAPGLKTSIASSASWKGGAPRSGPSLASSIGSWAPTRPLP